MTTDWGPCMEQLIGMGFDVNLLSKINGTDYMSVVCESLHRKVCELLLERAHALLFDLQSWMHIFKNVIYPPFACAIGLFGNIMALLLIREHRALRKLSSSNYLITVALSSIAVLCCLVSPTVDSLVSFVITVIDVAIVSAAIARHIHDDPMPTAHLYDACG